MDDCCSGTCAPPAVTKRYRRILWIALAVNAAMFGVEVIGGMAAASTSLQADALDFLGDTGNYAISLFVLGMAVTWRARAALIKGLTMGAFGVWVIGITVSNLVQGTVPEPFTMGWIGALALVANVTVAVLLYAFREGDSNMRSVWLCSRNDAIGNVAVLLAALGVFGTGTAWPDLAVAAIMAGLGLTAAWQVVGAALNELRLTPRSASLDPEALAPHESRPA
jgi:Co/Zn/Cd efflux system component